MLSGFGGKPLKRDFIRAIVDALRPSLEKTILRTAMGLGSGSINSANGAVVLNGTGKLPAVDGSQLTGIGAPSLQAFRLTLTSATPVTTADVTGATTIYCTPYKGNQIALYDGSSAWNTRTSAEFSLALGTLSSGKPYDVFCYDNAGTPTLEFLAWTSDTARATALVYQDGVLVKSGATTRRYLGTFYTTSTTQTEDSVANRYLWNYYNRVSRRMSFNDTTASWTYSTAAYRLRNNAAGNQLFYLQGVAEDCVPVASKTSVITSNGALFDAVYIAIGIDSTATAVTGSETQILTRNDYNGNGGTEYIVQPQLGKHYVAALEMGFGSNTQTWVGAARSLIAAIVQG